MNTDCSKCFFSNDSFGCVFGIPELIKDNYTITQKNKANYIENYKCSYAFSLDQYEKYKEELPEDMAEFMRIANKLHYYLIVCFDDVDCLKIIETYEKKIKKLHTMPNKLSIVCNIKNKNEIKNIIDYLRKNANNIDWKIHNLVSDQSDEQKLFDILNVNLINTVKNIWYVHGEDLDSLTEDLNYINFLSKVVKPKYAAIRKNDTNLNGLFISADNLRLIKNEHKEKYVSFLQNDSTIVKKYYEQ